MKKRRFIVGILVLSMILLGTGYAYWTHSLHVTTTATTGDLNVKFLDLTLYGNYEDEGGWTIFDGVGGAWQTGDHFFTRGFSNYNKVADLARIKQYQNDTTGYHQVSFDIVPTGDVQTIDDYIAEKGNNYDSNHLADAYTGKTKIFDNFSITLNKIYPGYAQAFNADIANFGTVAASFSSLKANLNTEKSMSDALNHSLGMSIYLTREYGAMGETGNDLFCLMEQGFGAENIFEIGGVKFVRFSALSGMELINFIENLNQLFVDPSKNRVDVYLAIGMDPAAENNTEFGSATIDLEFNWSQFIDSASRGQYKENIMKGK